MAVSNLPGPGVAQSRYHFVSLDGLRGVAAIAVAVGHLHPTVHSQLHLPNTGLAVDFFFMLSGFVIAHAYGERIESQGRTAYIAARVIRLYPMVVLGALIGSAYYWIVRSTGVPLGLLGFKSLLLVPTFGANGIDGSFLPFNPPAWSLFFEMVASVLFGLGIWRGSGRAVLLLVIAAAIPLALGVREAGTFDLGWSSANMSFGFFRVFFGFGAGVLLYRVHRSGGVPRLPGSFLFQALILAIILLAPPMSYGLQLAADFLVFPAILLSAVQNGSDSALCRRLGELSYPLYIVHWPVFLWIGLLLGMSWLTPVVAFVGAVFTAAAALKFYDAPVRERLAKWFRKATATQRSSFALANAAKSRAQL